LIRSLGLGGGDDVPSRLFDYAEPGPPVNGFSGGKIVRANSVFGTLAPYSTQAPPSGAATTCLSAPWSSQSSLQNSHVVMATAPGPA